MRQISWALGTHIELSAPRLSAKTACTAYEILIAPAIDIIPAEVREDKHRVRAAGALVTVSELPFEKGHLIPNLQRFLSEQVIQ